MDLEAIVRSVDEEIARLQHIRWLLDSAASNARTPDYAKKPSDSGGKQAKARRTLSPEARAKIAAAQKARWASHRKAAADLPGQTNAAKSAPGRKSAATKTTSKTIRKK